MKLVVEGSELADGPRLVSDLPGEATPLVSTADRIEFRLHIPATTQTGIYPLRVRTDTGASNLLLFRVGLFPEILEAGPGEPACSLALPVTVNGTLGAAEVDHFRFRVDAGQRVVFDVEARRLGSALDPTLSLLTPNGRKIALSEDERGLNGDARIDHTFDAAGEYVLEIHDVTYALRTPGFYRVGMGPLPYATAVFPLGGPRGGEVALRFEGGHLAVKDARVKLPPSRAMRVRVNVPPHGGSFPFSLAVSDLPEVLEGSREKPDDPIEILMPTVVNGRILELGEVDRYELTVSPGDRLIVAAESSALGSRLDGYLRVQDINGKELATADDVNGRPDPRLELTVPGGVERLVISLYDLHRGGGIEYGYRLTVREKTPDYRLSCGQDVISLGTGGSDAFVVDAERQGYGGPIRLRPMLLPGGVTFTGGVIHAGENRGVMRLAAAPTGVFDLFELVIRGDAKEASPRYAGTTVVLASEGPRPVSIWRRESILLASARPTSFRLTRAPQRAPAELVVGLPNTLPVTIEDGIDGDGAIVLTGLSGVQGVDFEKLEIKSKKESVSIVVRVGAKTPVGRSAEATIVGTLRRGGRTVRSATEIFIVTVVAPFRVELAASSVETEVGAESTLRGTISRHAPFVGEVSVKLDGLPAGTEVAPVVMSPESSRFTVTIPGSVATAPGTVALGIVVSAKLGEAPKQTEYKAPRTGINLVVKSKTP